MFYLCNNYVVRCKKFCNFLFWLVGFDIGFFKKFLSILILFGVCDKFFEFFNEFWRGFICFVYRECKIRLLLCFFVRVVRGWLCNCFNILKVCGVKIDDSLILLKKNFLNVLYNIKILWDFLVEINFFEFCLNKKKIIN